MRRPWTAAFSGTGLIALAGVAGWTVVVGLVAVTALLGLVLCWIVADAGRSTRLTDIIGAVRRPRDRCTAPIARALGRKRTASPE